MNTIAEDDDDKYAKYQRQQAQYLDLRVTPSRWGVAFISFLSLLVGGIALGLLVSRYFRTQSCFENYDAAAVFPCRYCPTADSRTFLLEEYTNASMNLRLKANEAGIIEPQELEVATVGQGNTVWQPPLTITTSFSSGMNIDPTASYPAPLCVNFDYTSSSGSPLVLKKTLQESISFRLLKADVEGAFDYVDTADKINTTLRACVRYGPTTDCSTNLPESDYYGFCCDFPGIRGGRFYTCSSDVKILPRQDSVFRQAVQNRSFTDQIVVGNYSRRGDPGVFTLFPFDIKVDFSLWVTKAESDYNNLIFKFVSLASEGFGLNLIFDDEANLGSSPVVFSTNNFIIPS